MITVRPAARFDTAIMAQLLNEIITIGGTTAIARPVTGGDLAEWMASIPDRSAWHVAWMKPRQVVGFQWIESAQSCRQRLPRSPPLCQVGQTGLGIGSALFDATAQAAKTLGYVWINANIRADNDGGLTYYQSRGFQ